MKSVFLSIGLSLFVLAGCCVPWNGPAVVTARSGARLCAKHRIPLVTAKGFCMHSEPKTYIDPDLDAVERVARCYPHAIPWGEWLGSGHGGDPATITYCPECERGAQRIRR